MKKNTFKLNYAPHFGTFKHSAGSDPFDQLQYMADLGFTHIEDNAFKSPILATLMGIAMMEQTPEFLSKMGKTLEKLGIKMGTFTMGPVCWPPNPAYTSGNSEWREQFLEQCRAAIDVCKRLNSHTITVAPDAADHSLPVEIQTANVIESLRRAADIFEPHNIVMVLEPLSFPPQVFLKTSPQCYLLAKAVNSPSCKILFDLYHLQRNEGDLIKHIDAVWDEIGYFQIGDVPNRHEPGTGEINLKPVLKHVCEKQKTTGKEFVFGMEHYNSIEGAEGEHIMLEAYKELDNFL